MLTGHKGRAPGRPNMFPRRDDELRQYAAARREDGKYRYSSEDISSLMHIPTSTLVRRLKELGLSRNDHRHVIDWNDEMIGKLRILATIKEDGKLLTTQQIAERMGTTHDIIWKRMRQHNIGYDEQGRSLRDNRLNLPNFKRKVEAEARGEELQPKQNPNRLPLVGPTLPVLPSLQMPLPKCFRRPHLELVHG